MGQDRRSSLAHVLDVRERLQQDAPTDEHKHYARGIRVETAVAGPERMHFHKTAQGYTDSAPNKPGHRHRLRTGGWTDGSNEVWSSRGVGRL